MHGHDIVPEEGISLSAVQRRSAIPVAPYSGNTKATGPSALAIGKWSVRTARRGSYSTWSRIAPRATIFSAQRPKKSRVVDGLQGAAAAASASSRGPSKLRGDVPGMTGYSPTSAPSLISFARGLRGAGASGADCALSCFVVSRRTGFSRKSSRLSCASRGSAHESPRFPKARPVPTAARSTRGYGPLHNSMRYWSCTIDACTVPASMPACVSGFSRTR